MPRLPLGRWTCLCKCCVRSLCGPESSIHILRATIVCIIPIIMDSLLEYIGLCEHAYRLTSSWTVRNQPHAFHLLASTMLWKISACTKRDLVARQVFLLGLQHQRRYCAASTSEFQPITNSVLARHDMSRMDTLELPELRMILKCIYAQLKPLIADGAWLIHVLPKHISEVAVAKVTRVILPNRSFCNICKNVTQRRRLWYYLMRYPSIPPQDSTIHQLAENQICALLTGIHVFGYTSQNVIT